MIVLSPLEALALVKARYTKRWKGPDGKWRYSYASGDLDKDPMRERGKAEQISVVRALKAAGIENLKDLDAYATKHKMTRLAVLKKFVGDERAERVMRDIVSRQKPRKERG